MKAIQLIDSLHTGGAERMAVNIANALSEVGISSFLCATREEGVLKRALNQDVNYFYARRKGILGIPGILRLYRFVKQEGIDVIHAHSSSYAVGVILKMLRPSLKLVWHVHYGNTVNSPLYRQLLSRSISLICDAVIVVNQKLLEWARQHLGQKNIILIDNFAVPVGSQSLVPTLFGNPEKRIVQVANYRIEKNLEFAVELMASLHDKFPDWSLLLVGHPIDISYFTKLKELVKFWNLEKKVFFITDITDVSSVLNQADIAILTSHSEGLPLALLEYGLSGLPVIVTDVGDCARVVGSEGCVVAADDEKSFLLCLEELMLDPLLRKTRGEAFQKRVYHNFSKEKAIKDILEIYKLDD